MVVGKDGAGGVEYAGRQFSTERKRTGEEAVAVGPDSGVELILRRRRERSIIYGE